jgi:hypothetical protein
MAVPKVGEVSDDLSLTGRRDAFHVPAILCKLGHDMWPGTIVDVDVSTNTATAAVNGCERAHGIVDPMIYFGQRLAGCRSKGDVVWVFLKPGITSNLTHHFEIDIEAESDWEDEASAEVEPEDDGGYDECRGCD